MTLTVASLALACVVLLAAGYLSFFIMAQIPALAPTVRKVWPTVFSQTVVVGVIAGAFWLGGWILAVVLLLHAARVGYEAACVTEHRHRLAHPGLVGSAIAGLCALAAFLPTALLCYAAPGILALLVALIRKDRTGPDSKTSVLLDLALFPTLPLVVLTAAGLDGRFGVLLLAAFIMSETFDSYASLFGKAFGKHKAFPALSPNKTVEGLACGALLLMLTAAGVGSLLGGIPVLMSATVALIAGGFTVAGDLTASRLKRLSGVKDYPQVLPHQGGLLDITDSWIATGAGLVVLATLLGAG